MGDLYALPIGGGEAKALTSGVCSLREETIPNS